MNPQNYAVSAHQIELLDLGLRYRTDVYSHGPTLSPAIKDHNCFGRGGYWSRISPRATLGTPVGIGRREGAKVNGLLIRWAC